MNANTQEIKAHLGLAPRTAKDLAESTGLAVESVYESLVYLHDQGEAKIDISYGNNSHTVNGWVEA